MIQEILDLILIGEFEQAYKKELEVKENIGRRLFEKAYDLENIAIYSYYNFKIARQENADDHYQASLILSQILNTINGAYDIAFYHAKKAIELDPNNLEYKEYILIFQYYPDLTIHINFEIFKTYAYELLASDKENMAAKSFFQSLSISRKK